VTRPALTDRFQIGGVEIANRVLLAPLAGIGNWFVRLQARRHGAGMAVSEMVSSHALYYGNERTQSQILVVHPEEHPVSMQLFGADPEVMGEAAAIVAAAGVDLIDLNMGCPVKKVRRSGAGASLLSDHERALDLARAAGAGSGLPITVKLRSGLEPGDRSGLELAQRLVAEAGVAAVAMHPRPASLQHQGEPDYDLVRELVELLPVPVIVSGGLAGAAQARAAFRASGADALMIARGSFGNPWVFEELLEADPEPPGEREIVAELLWLVDRAEEHLGQRACHYLRKFYPWYLDRLGASRAEANRLQRIEDLDAVREALRALLPVPLAAAV
jgi:nifR3 family TIM-barrel protein